MAKNFPMAKDDAGNFVTIISGVTVDQSGHEVRFSDGARELVKFLMKTAPELIIE